MFRRVSCLSLGVGLSDSSTEASHSNGVCVCGWTVRKINVV